MDFKDKEMIKNVVPVDIVIMFQINKRDTSKITTYMVHYKDL